MTGVVAHQELEYYAQRYAIIGIIALSLLVFVSPLVLRLAAGAPITPGAESYTLLRHADTLLEGRLFDTTGEFVAAPYTVLLAVMALFGVPWLLPPLLATCLAITLYLYLVREYRQMSIVAFGVVALIVSPAMSVLASWQSPMLLCMLLVLLALSVPRVAPVALAFAVLTHPVGGAIAAIGVVCYHAVGKRWTEAAWSLGASAIAFAAALPLHGADAVGELLLGAMSSSAVFELGAASGVSIFLCILACYGIIVDFSGRRIAAFSVFAGLAALSFVFPSAIPFFTVAVAVLSGHAVHHLLVAEWRLTMLQESLLILVGCIALFLMITTIRERIADDPGAELSHALIALRNADREGAVLTSPSYAPFVEYYSGRVAMLGPGDAPDVLHSRDAATVYTKLIESDVAFIVVTADMREELFADSEDGMLFLLAHSGRFVPVEPIGTTGVWYFIRM